MRTRRSVAGVVAVLLVAGCGSSGTSTRTTGGPSRAEGLAFATCMRSHGLADFPDPNPGHGLQFDLPTGLTPQSPAFRSAGAACRHLVSLPVGGAGGSSAGEDTAALKLARCMRSHGVPDYPDPTYRNGRPTQQPLTTFGIKPDAPAVQRAEKACGGGSPG